MIAQLRHNKTLVRLLYGVIVAACFAVLMILPGQWGSTAFGAITVIALGVALVAQQRERVGTWIRTHRETVAGVLALLAVVSMALCAYYFHPTEQALGHYRPTSYPMVHIRTLAYWFLGLGVAALVGALVFTRRLPRLTAPVPRALASFAWRDALLTGAGALALWALAEINGGLVGVDALEGTWSDVQFALLGAGCILVAVGLGGLRRDDLRLNALPRREIALVTALMLIGFGVRFWQLGTAVRGLVDEGHFAFGTTAFFNHTDIKLLAPMPTSASFPYIFSYLQSWTVAILGRNFWGLRLVSVIMGTLTIPALYLLARAACDRLTAITAALILLTFPPHVHYSRLALNNIADPLFGTLALAFLARGWRSGRRLDYALAGVSMGLTQYFYEGGRLLYPMLAAAWMGAGLVLWRPRPSWRGLVVALVAFVLIAAPVYYTLQGLDFPLLDRLDKTQLDNAYWARNREPDTFETRVNHFRHSLAMYVNSPENTFVYYYLYYGGKHPLILEYIVPAFLLGVVIAVWRWRGPEVLPAGWVLATSLGNAMLVESGVTARYVVVFPALALLIAVGIRYTLPLIWPRSWPDAINRGLVVTLAITLALAQGLFYYGPFMDRFNNELRNHVDADAEDALLRSRYFPPGTHIHLIGRTILPQLDSQRFMDFLADDLDVSVLRPDSVTQGTLEQLPRTVDHAFYFRDPDTLRKLEAVFGPRGLQDTPYNLPLGKSFLLFYVPAGTW